MKKIEKKYFCGFVLGLLMFLTLLPIPSNKVAAQGETVLAIEECINGQTACLVCGGSCIANCCNKPVPTLRIQ